MVGVGWSGDDGILRYDLRSVSTSPLLELYDGVVFDERAKSRRLREIAAATLSHS